MSCRLLSLLVILCSLSTSAVAASPDILFIAIDDMNDWTTLFDDQNPIQTPNLKRLASRGAFFTKAYCAAPGCNPSRTAILTGLRPSSSGVYGNRDAWKQIIPDVVTLPQYFTESGYATKGAGKIFHHGKTGADREDNPSFQDFYPLQIHANAPPENYNGYVKGRDAKQLASASWDWGEHDVAKQTDEYTVEHVNNVMATHPKDEPLFLAAGIFRPHLPFWAPPATFKRYPFDQVVMPPMPANDLDDVPAIGQTMAHTEYFIWENTTKQPVNSPGSLKKMVQSYQASADYADEMVGRLLDQLEATGRAENTIIVLWADHGYHLGDKEACVKFTLWEKANHVPFIIVAPGVTTPGTRIDRPVSLVDIYPTLVELAGLPAKDDLDGQSLVPLLKNSNAKWDRPALMTQLRGNHAIRSDRYRYIRYNDGTEELYDHENDPWEHDNLASDKKYAAVIAEHKEWLPKNEAVTPTASQRPLSKQKAAALAAVAAAAEKAVARVKPASKKQAARQKDAGKEILVADFESNSYNGWTTTGEAFSDKPAIAGVTHRNKLTGHRGKGLANSFLNGDGATGTLTSPSITLNRKFLNFMIGGGAHPGETCVNLLVDEKVVNTATGFSTKNSRAEAVLQPVAWDVSKYAGQNARIEIVDHKTGGWGHITADHFVLANVPTVEPSLIKDVPLVARLTVTDTHLVVPVSNRPRNQGGLMHRLGIYVGDELVQDFNVSLPEAGQPFWNASYPLAHFDLQGKKITVKPTDSKLLPETYRMAFNLIRIGDDNPLAVPNDYDQPYRNQFHLTSRRGWNNDPNGMVYHNGQYHLYYQYNPFGIFWGNMHWGHFVSKDLINWRQHSIALYQKTVKDMAFSGGGFVDFNNSSGLGKNTLFVAFTSTGRGECLAYSKDNGLTFTELPENPVVKHQGRDPKIIWHEPSQKWIMVVYNNDPSVDVAVITPNATTRRANANIDFYTSSNLRQWTHASSFTDPDRDAVFECPEFFNLPIEGQAGQSRWILYGAQNRYFIGQFDGQKFTKESGPHGDSHGNFYAAQTFSDTPDGRRIQIGWVRGGAPFARQFPAQIANQGFTLPHAMVLRQTPDGLRVFFNPVSETKKLRGQTLVDASNLSPKQANALLQACKGQLTEVLIEYQNVGDKQLRINGIDASFAGRAARIFTDRTINEIYIDFGISYQVRVRAQDDFGVTQTISDPSNGPIKTLKIFQLKSIW